MDITPNGAVSVAVLASGSPTLVSLEAVFSISGVGKGNAAVEGT
jgi:hypothetical protein